MMSRKDYRAFAAAFAESEPPMGEPGSSDRYGYEIWVDVLERVADIFQADNPWRFDRSRFMFAATADTAATAER